jgi:beta-galactosidase
MCGRGAGNRAGRTLGKLAVSLGALLALATTGLGARTSRPLDGGWRFHKGDFPGAQAIAFDDAAWSTVRLPHTWNAEDGTDRRYYRGPGWYRLGLNLTPAQLQKRLFLRFGAASLVAKVYLNGQEVGDHRGGFAAFVLPISRFAKAGANELAVRVDNSRNTDVPPLSGDFTIYGGLYRNVELLAMDEVGVSPLDDGGPGVYLTPKLSAEAADVEVRTVVLGSAGPVSVRTVVKDAKGRVVGSAQVSGTVAADEAKDLTASVRIVRPHLWDGVRDPYLYRTRVQVMRGGKVLDEVVQPLGLREFHVDPDRGVILNGKPYDLHGVNVHQGRADVGWAVTPAMEDEDYALIREMGCTAVRMCHYQHDEHEVDLCDRLGLGVWAELAVVNQVSDTSAFHANAEQQLRELIKQNYNHPSVMVWSLYNEPWIDKAKGDGEWRQMEGLSRLARGMDPSRLVSGAMNWGPDYWLTWVGTNASQNHYWGWYDGSADQWPAKLDTERRATGGRPFGISEYGAGGSAFQHEVPPKMPKAASRWHPEEWQAQVHETVWPALEARPWIWEKFIWVMFDFASAGRDEGDRPGINDKGLVTADRKVRKDAFYYYKARWTKAPFVHLTSARFSPRPAGTTEIRAYSNGSRVELTMDGKDLGEMTRVAPGVFVRTGVDLTLGSHDVGARGDGRAVDRIRWTVTEAVPVR